MMIIPRPSLQFTFALSLSLGVFCSLSVHASSPEPDLDTIEAQTAPSPRGLERIPSWIDQSPTILPPHSNEARVATTQETENIRWTDRQQKSVREWVDRTAHHIDDWFGEPDIANPADATLRIIFDNRWNKHDGYEIDPRIRGKIRLPTLEKKVSIVFGDDSLDNELATNNAITNEYPATTTDKALDRERTKESNGSLAVRWSNFSKNLPFETDLDLGIRSGDDIYLRFEAAKDWQLEHDFYFYAEQIYRYGIDSENYFRTNLEFKHARPDSPFLSNQFSLTFADRLDDDFVWDNFTFRQHQFFKNHHFNYGIYTGGFYDQSNLRLNSWGPYVSWRQPFMREWLFVQGDLNYLNDHRDDRSHFFGALVRLEALF